MKEVDKSLIDKFLGIYNPHIRYLKKEFVDLEKEVEEGFGFFEVPDYNVFTVDHSRAPHVTESETQIMITQMMYPFMAEVLNKGMDGLRLDYDQFFEIAKDGVFLISELKKYSHWIYSAYGVEGKIQLFDVTKKDCRDGTKLWITDIHTEVYPPQEYREYEKYNEFEVQLIFKPSMVFGPDFKYE